MSNEPNGEIPKFIRRLMPVAGDVELREATETFRRYIAVVRRIYERVTQERIEADSSDLQSCGKIRDANPDV